MANCHVVFFPFMAYGHTIPMADMAVLLASRGLKTTIITTPTNAPRFSRSIQKTINYDHQMELHIIQFKDAELGLPAGSENPDQPVSDELLSTFFEAISMLQEPVEQFIRESHPNCIVADMFYPWSTEIAAKFNIPRIVFNGTGFFPQCVANAVGLIDHAKNVQSDSELFIVPHLPHEIKLTRKQLPHFESEAFKGFLKVLIEAMEAEVKSYGVIFNSFYELEPEYVHHYREVMNRKGWHIGPVSLCNRNTEDKSERGKKSSIDEHECLKWMESKAPDSVVYVSFGTIVKVTRSQVYEIAMGLEACNEYFIWVIKNEQEQWLPEGFQERTAANGKGLVIKGWAPQVLILDHESVGGFVTHCGWNSVLEGVTGGVAMVAWPVMAEQFYNAKLVTDVLKIGVSIGDVEWSATASCDGVERVAIEKAVARVMGGEEGDEMRRRAQVLKEKATAAVKEGGSSYSDLNAFIQDIKTFKSDS
ncbi:scopoletin glucosyltransferase [Lactuca sativa]|uniref:Glycosyltransferase N-terminal domain-containing protein n=1 Tax=Lactuca sativa TaxID=4236 RepID=A0A9R1X7S5_LACSA|nr:scopoletin glucosyltransferase [Lactuca sativa]KAJ0204040.1 hypothetical protein LSAT_V11C500270360 [Lactuca sativa]